jgi:hypothetical protein
MDHGPCPSHRFSYVNVIEAMRARAAAPSVPPQAPAADDEQPALATRAIGIG